jgi:hypothetical protein
MPRVRLTTRRLMAIVGLCALALSGLQGGLQPGIHYRLPGGLRWGICRNDGLGRSLGSYGRPGQAACQIGVWRSAGPGEYSGPMVAGLRLRDGILSAWVGRGEAVVW